MTVRNFIVSTEPGVQAGLSDTLPRALTLAILGVLAAACSVAPPAAPPTPAPVPAAPVAVVPPPPPSRWAIASATTPASFIVESHAQFNTRADSLSRSDSSIARTTLRVVPRGAAIDVTISGYSITSSYSQPLALTAPSRAVGRYDINGGVEFEGPGQSSCTSLTSTAFESTRDLWVRWPAEVGIGTGWRDSVSVAACRDGIPLRVVLVRNYRVASVSDDSLARTVEIERTSVVSVSGNGVLRGDTITVSGEGAGSARLRVGATTGWLIDGMGSSVLQLRAVSRSRTQIVDQRVEFTARQEPSR